MHRSKLSTLLFITVITTTAMFLINNAHTVFAELNSSNYRIQGDAVGTGSAQGTSTSYGISGEINPFTDLADSSNYRQELGYNPRLQAFTPEAPTLANPSSQYYDRLHLTIDPSTNPDDTVFAIAISPDNFSTVYYVQDDTAIGATLGAEDYQTYSDWGAGSGFLILGLEPNTPYRVQVKALHGDFTETNYSPASDEVVTSVPHITLTSSSGSAELGVLNVNSVNNTTDVTLTVDTNGENGYQTYIRGTGNGASPGLADGTGTLIPSNDTTLIAGISGYGAQASSGSASIAAKYNVLGDTVGAVELTPQDLASNNQPVTNENIDVRFKSTISNTQVAGEYTDTVYFTISSNL